MQFTYKPLNLNFEFCKSDFVNIIFENKFWFCDFIESIKLSASEIENKFIFNEESDIYFKDIEIIFSPFNLNFRNINNGIMKYLIKNDYCIDYDYIKSELVSFGDSVVLESELNIDYDDTQINLLKILKLFNFKLCDTDSSHIGKLINYLETYHKIFPNTSFCFINCCSYCEPKDLDLIFEWCKLNNVSVFNVASEISDSDMFDKIFIIDKDLCLLN